MMGSALPAAGHDVRIYCHQWLGRLGRLAGADLVVSRPRTSTAPPPTKWPAAFAAAATRSSSAARSDLMSDEALRHCD